MECKVQGKKASLVKVSTGRKCAKFAKCKLDKDGDRRCTCDKGYEGDGSKKCEKIEKPSSEPEDEPEPENEGNFIRSSSDGTYYGLVMPV